MKLYSIAFLIYGDSHSDRNALTEEKYRDLANAFLAAEFTVESVLYTDEQVDVLRDKLLHFNAILIWVNPIEQGKDRRKLDALLGCVDIHYRVSIIEQASCQKARKFRAVFS